MVVVVYEGPGRMDGSGFNACNWNDSRFHVSKELELCDIDILVAIGLGCCCRRTVLWRTRSSDGGSRRLFRRRIFIYEGIEEKPLSIQSSIFVQEESQISTR